MATKSISDLNFECPVCMDKILPPVYQCINGHILCETCQNKVSHCPVCRKRFLDKERIRCLEVERIIEMQEHSCPHFLQGCRLRLKWNEIREHELDCHYASLNFCDLMGIKSCSASVSKQDSLNHFGFFHNSYVRCIVWDCHVNTAYNITMQVPRVNSETIEYVAFNVKGQDSPTILLLCIKFAGGRVSWAPYILGSKKTASLYYYQIQMGRAAEPMCNISWSGPVFSIDTLKIDDSGLCLNLPETNLRIMSTLPDVNFNIYYQMKISFHRNQSAVGTESSTSQAENVELSTVQS